VTNRRIVVAEVPDGQLEERHFRLEEAPMPVPGPGEVLCRTLYASIDPVNRMSMTARTYRGGLGAGDVMAAFTLSELPDGTIVSSQAGWQEWAALPEADVVPIEVLGPLSHHLGVLGLNGLTAYFGLELGTVKPGETVVVSAAAGATGNVAGQLAKRAGARVVGIASAGKLGVLRELGFDAALDRRALDLKAACPDGIDVYFDNVGGALLDAVFSRMAPHGRIVCCGTLSAYDGAAPEGPRAVPGLLISRRLRMEGFVVLDYVDRWAQAARELAAADLTVLEEVVDGLENAPSALVDVLAGRNVGKRLVRVQDR
jgi:NADPH-dependent curcumin reductase CurA